MRRIAGIDIGTNSLRLLILDIDENRNFRTIYKRLKTTRIGKELDKNGYILPKKIEENLEELININKICSEYKCDETIFFGTEGLRKASNSKELLEKFYSRTGKKIKILTGEEEAKLTFEGVLKSIDKTLLYEKISVLDIGGGSTEISRGRYCTSSSEIKYDGGISFSIGCVVMTEKFNTGKFPVDENGIKNMQNYLRVEIGKISFDISKDQLIGVGGTITCLSAIKQGLKEYDEKLVHNSILYRTDIEEILEMLLKIDIKEREKLPGLNDKR
ncbi:hypothetical protein KA977_04490, partial [Candidatus Dependentiae bacterium]|nr:hypothetical protein [Candidatus Dependentiae bacterium]